MCVLSHSFIFPSDSLRPVMNGFIDFDNAVSNLTDSRFVEFLYDWHRMFAGNEMYQHAYAPYTHAVTEALREIPPRNWHPFHPQAHSIYASHLAFHTWEQSFFQFNPYFTHCIPLTDEQGRVVAKEFGFGVHPTGRSQVFGQWALPVISARANGPLAWEFVKHMADAFAASSDTNYHFNTTVVRAHANRQMTASLNWNFGSWGERTGVLIRCEGGEILGMHYRDFFADFEEQQRVVDDILGRAKAVAEMPFARPSFVPFTLYEEILNTFLIMPGSMMAAQATAQDLHNRVTLWLME